MEMKALVLFSGGIDSTTALGLAIKKYGKDQVIALSVSYGQKHDKEILWRGASVPGFK
jgi:7-cyano-7-deazaguanine synthase